VAVLDEGGSWPLLPKGHSSRGTPISYPGLAGRQLAAGFGGHVPAHRLPLLFDGCVYYSRTEVKKDIRPA
jgi:hypothetical protein